MTENRNCISYWFPRLQESGVPVPKTWITRTGVDLQSFLYELDSNKDAKLPDGFEAFLLQLKVNATFAGSPCFLRTGITSGKHEWEKTCFVQDVNKISHRVMALIEFSILAHIMGLPTDVWAVREFLPLQVAFKAFRGMPVAREFRVFTKNGEISCIHPYWPKASIDNPDSENWQAELAAISEVTDGVEWQAKKLIFKIAPHFDGDWSIDVCPTVNHEWYVTDMAVAEESFHWPSCPNAPKRRG